jgi:AcrR family transcriptional regulator
MSENSLPHAQANENETPRLNRRQAAKVRTRQKVLEAARTLFAERGYEPATIRDIAKGAGMSTGAVFANFQDKAELFEAVLSEDMGMLAGTMKAGAAAETTLRGRLMAALTAGYHGSLDQLPLVQAVVARSWFQPVAAGPAPPSRPWSWSSQTPCRLVSVKANCVRTWTCVCSAT